MKDNHSRKFHVNPRDLLFLRDARPMEASDAGLGAHWPRPDQVWNAFINAFHRRWSEFQKWEGHKHHFKEGIDKHSNSSFRFGGLKTVGPFPMDVKRKEIYFPCPLDLSADENGTLHPMGLIDADGTDSPPPLSKAFSSVVLGKEAPPEWISSSDYVKYLQGEVFKPDKVDLYDSERNVGIGIDSETRTTADGAFYQAEYLRFRQNTRMAVEASCVILGEDRQEIDVFERIAGEEGIPLVLGGQQGVALVSEIHDQHDFRLPERRVIAQGKGPVFVRWTLLTPAVFPEIHENLKKNVKRHPGGWLPTWIDPNNGWVMLPKENVARKPEESRQAWRERVAMTPKLKAKLVAARIGKPEPFSGWDLRTGPKPTLLAVPSGSAYVFECESDEDSTALAGSLDWNGRDDFNRRSTIFGEKGFGLGVCSSWDLGENASSKK